MSKEVMGTSTNRVLLLATICAVLMLNGVNAQTECKWIYLIFVNERDFGVCYETMIMI